MNFQTKVAGATPQVRVGVKIGIRLTRRFLCQFLWTQLAFFIILACAVTFEIIKITLLEAWGAATIPTALTTVCIPFWIVKAFDITETVLEEEKIGITKV